MPESINRTGYFKITEFRNKKNKRIAYEVSVKE
jgi:hypothetical protein